MSTEVVKRLIEVDLPIAAVSSQSRREKSIRHGHISTLHIWWARRPLAACRTVILAALWPDPADANCPPRFKREAARLMKNFRERTGGKSRDWEDALAVRAALLDFLAEFAKWENSNSAPYLETSRALVQVAHEVLGGEPGSRPLVVDPFAGGGTIPLEALRVGAEAFASDVNPIPVILNKITLEYIPRFGPELIDQVKKWGSWVKTAAEKQLAAYYPKDKDGSSAIAYLWARTIRCEGASCGTEIPLLKSLWLAKKGNRSVAIRLVPDKKAKRVDFTIVEGATKSDVGTATSRRGSATCPVCGVTTPVDRVRTQLSDRRGGTSDARMFCVVTTRPGQSGCGYRAPRKEDIDAAGDAERELVRRKKGCKADLSLVPDESLPVEGTLGFRVQKYGMREWGDLFTPRQTLVLVTYAELVRDVAGRVTGADKSLGTATATVLSMALGKLADYSSSLCGWRTARSCVRGTFGRQALPITWDFGEMNPFAGSSGDWGEACDFLTLFIQRVAASGCGGGVVERVSATGLPLPTDSVAAVVTDPPYYDAVPYADLSDYFYVWHKRSIGQLHPRLFASTVSPKEEEAIVNLAASVNGVRKDAAFYESQMRLALIEARRVLAPNGVCVVVFAHKTTAGWEAMIQSILDAGWIVTASWPIDTERPGRLRAQDSAALASSVHLVLRPREREGTVGEWRAVLDELPRRIHEWMPRLEAEGVVGADAIFACLGPALEGYSRYSSVERASGERVTLRTYLEHVWEAVAKEAVSMIFKDADAGSLEPDGRLVAMWLWTLGATDSSDDGDDDEEEAETDEQDTGAGKSAKKKAGYTLEFDAARKIAQGLGVTLEALPSLVALEGERARLLPVRERAPALFARRAETSTSAKARGRRAKKTAELQQGLLFDGLAVVAAATDEAGGLPAQGDTVLDRVHQSMLLFAAGRGEALRSFLVEHGAGKDARFWKLAQSLSALYPKQSDEKRWVDGVLARKKGLGL